MVQIVVLATAILYLLWLAFAEVLGKASPSYEFFQKNGLTFAGKVFSPMPRKLTPMLRFRVALNSGEEIGIETDPSKTHSALFRNRAWVYQHNLVKANNSQLYLAYCRYFLQKQRIDLKSVVAVRLDIRNVLTEQSGDYQTHDFYWDLLGDGSLFEHKTSFA